MDSGLQFVLIIPLVGMPHIITHRIEYLKTANTQLVKQYKIGSVDNHQAISIYIKDNGLAIYHVQAKN